MVLKFLKKQGQHQRRSETKSNLHKDREKLIFDQC